MNRLLLYAQSVYASAPSPWPVMIALGIAVILIVGLMVVGIIERRRKP